MQRECSRCRCLARCRTEKNVRINGLYCRHSSEMLWTYGHVCRLNFLELRLWLAFAFRALSRSVTRGVEPCHYAPWDPAALVLFVVSALIPPVEDVELRLELMARVLILVPAPVKVHDRNDPGHETESSYGDPGRHVGALERVGEEVVVGAGVSVGMGEVHRQDAA
jgi:hypothetical protein